MLIVIERWVLSRLRDFDPRKEFSSSSCLCSNTAVGDSSGISDSTGTANFKYFEGRSDSPDHAAWGHGVAASPAEACKPGGESSDEGIAAFSATLVTHEATFPGTIWRVSAFGLSKHLLKCSLQKWEDT